MRPKTFMEESTKVQQSKVFVAAVAGRGEGNYGIAALALASRCLLPMLLKKSTI
jgi:hypothetical protein